MTSFLPDTHDAESAARIAAARERQKALTDNSEYERRAFRALQRFYEGQSTQNVVGTLQTTPEDDSIGSIENDEPAIADFDQDGLPEVPGGREYGRGRRQPAPMPGESWNGLITLFQQAKPGARRDMFLGWLKCWRNRSADASRKKFQQTRDYRQRRKLVREAEKEKTRIKNNAIKKEKYHADQTALGRTPRRNKNLSGLTAQEVALHKKAQAADRQRRKRKRDSSPA